ncbi:MAG: hypothetical protein M1832_000547 [Thelocarpon impressellum]|nr:MAG: hypothetical protein M1832_000547 [Thelocarpon impressellum]
MSSCQLNTFVSLVSTICSLLTVAVHTILYERGIYPASTFLSAQTYNCPVRQNRHPKVCKWIDDAVAAVKTELLKGTVSRIAVVIYSAASQPLERFLFDVSHLPIVPPSEVLTEFEEPLESDDEVDEVVEVVEPDVTAPTINDVDVEEQFRAIMQRLAFCGSTLGKLPDGCSFTLCVELSDEAEPPIRHPQPWIPSQPSLQPRAEGDKKTMGSDLGGVKTTPVRTVEAGDFFLEMWIEESRAKEKLDQERRKAPKPKGH